MINVQAVQAVQGYHQIEVIETHRLDIIHEPTPPPLVNNYVIVLTDRGVQDPWEEGGGGMGEKTPDSALTMSLHTMTDWGIRRDVAQLLLAMDVFFGSWRSR